MRFTIQREDFLRGLQRVVGVVERRHTLPVLANLLMVVENGAMTLTTTDFEVEMIARLRPSETEDGSITVGARKLFDICRALPDGCELRVALRNEKLEIRAGRSRFVLATLPASEFPVVQSVELMERVRLPEATLKGLLDRTAFAMAQQDVRYFLNGMLFDLKGELLRCVATDGHRLALAETRLEGGSEGPRRVIVPRKGVLELIGLFEGGEGEVELEFARNHLRVNHGDVTFTSKLLDGEFPDYGAVIPLGADRQARVVRDDLRAALQRAAILSGEKYRGVRLEFAPGHLRVVAHNPEQEEAFEELEAETSIDNLAVGFNVNYLLDAVGAIATEEALLCLRDNQSSCLVRNSDSEDVRHVIMPLRL